MEGHQGRPPEQAPSGDGRRDDPPGRGIVAPHVEMDLPTASRELQQSPGIPNAGSRGEHARSRDSPLSDIQDLAANAPIEEEALELLHVNRNTTRGGG